MLIRDLQVGIMMRQLVRLWLLRQVYSIHISVDIRYWMIALHSIKVEIIIIISPLCFFTVCFTRLWVCFTRLYGIKYVKKNIEEVMLCNMNVKS